MITTIENSEKTRRWCHNFLNVVAIILAMSTCLPLGYVSKYFDSSCVLNSNVYVVISKNETVVLNLLKTEWGEKELCKFTTFMPVIVAVHCFIWVWFFIYLKQTTNEEGQEGMVVIIMIILYGTIFVCMLVSSAIISSGFAFWCKTMVSNQKSLSSKTYGCSQLQELYWVTFERKRKFYSYFKLAEISSWLLTVVMAAQIGMVLYRAYVLISKTSESAGESESHDNHVYGQSLEAEIDSETGSLCFKDVNTNEPISGLFLDETDSSLAVRDSFNFSSKRRLVV